MQPKNIFKKLPVNGASNNYICVYEYTECMSQNWLANMLENTVVI